jgi:hypothetical protein
MRTEPVSRLVSLRRGWFSSVLLTVAILGPLSTILLPRAGEATSYCDRVRVGGDLYDPNLLVCEDFEAPTLHDVTGQGNGAPYYGPWYDDTGYRNARGNNSYWNKTYGSAVSNCAWNSGEPASPLYGSTCGYGTCFASVWLPGDPMTGNNYHACKTIVRNGEFNAEVGTIASPTNTRSGTPGVFDGQQSHGQRVGPREAAGITGVKYFSAQTNFGITMAVAFPNNTTGSAVRPDDPTNGIWASPWKGNEWGDRDGHGLFLFHNDNALSEQDPFKQFIFTFHSGGSLCPSKVAAATVRRGSVYCVQDANGTDLALYYRADPSGVYYKRSRDWPFGTWGCVRGSVSGWGTSTGTITIWFQGPGMTSEVAIVDFDMDLSWMNSTIDAFKFDNYSNGGNTAQATFRYEDNVHIRTGTPVSCSQIGFGSKPPLAPSGLVVR